MLRRLKFLFVAVLDILISQKANKKGADQSARMRRLVSSFGVRKPRRRGFLRRAQI